MITTTVEINCPPEAVRKILLNFPAYTEWHNGMIKSITPIGDGDVVENPLAVGTKLHCVMKDFTFDSVITENSPDKFQWQGPPVMGIAGLHTFSFEPSKITKDGTTLTQMEEYSKGLSFLMQPWLLGRSIKAQFEQYNRDLKGRAETIS